MFYIISGVLFRNDVGNFTYQQGTTEQSSTGVNLYASVWKAADSSVG